METRTRSQDSIANHLIGCCLLFSFYFSWRGGFFLVIFLSLDSFSLIIRFRSLGIERENNKKKQTWPWGPGRAAARELIFSLEVEEESKQISANPWLAAFFFAGLCPPPPETSKMSSGLGPGGLQGP